MRVVLSLTAINLGVEHDEVPQPTFLRRPVCERRELFVASITITAVDRWITFIFVGARKPTFRLQR